MQPPKCVNLHLAPTPPLFSTKVGGQGQAAGSSCNLLLYRHLTFQGLKSQFLSRTQGVVCWVRVWWRVGTCCGGPPAYQLRPFTRLQGALRGQLAGQFRLLQTHFPELLQLQTQGLLEGPLSVKQPSKTL